jgi:hypothetical protein
MTEFGLEIISTVETEDGQPVEFSTSTTDKNLKKDPAPNQPSDEHNPADGGRLFLGSLAETWEVGPHIRDGFIWEVGADPHSPMAFELN